MRKLVLSLLLSAGNVCFAGSNRDFGPSAYNCLSEDQIMKSIALHDSRINVAKGVLFTFDSKKEDRLVSLRQYIEDLQTTKSGYESALLARRK